MPFRLCAKIRLLPWGVEEGSESCVCPDSACGALPRTAGRGPRAIPRAKQGGAALVRARGGASRPDCVLACVLRTS